MKFSYFSILTSVCFSFNVTEKSECLENTIGVLKEEFQKLNKNCPKYYLKGDIIKALEKYHSKLCRAENLDLQWKVLENSIFLKNEFSKLKAIKSELELQISDKNYEICLARKKLSELDSKVNFMKFKIFAEYENSVNNIANSNNCLNFDSENAFLNEKTSNFCYKKRQLEITRLLNSLKLFLQDHKNSLYVAENEKFMLFPDFEPLNNEGFSLNEKTSSIDNQMLDLKKEIDVLQFSLLESKVVKFSKENQKTNAKQISKVATSYITVIENYYRLLLEIRRKTEKMLFLRFYLCAILCFSSMLLLLYLLRLSFK